VNRRRGSVFVVALATVAILTLIAATAATSIRADLLAAQNKIERRRAERSAQSAVHFAMVSLQEADPNATTEDDEWIDLDGTISYTVGQATFRVQVLDLGSRINLNTATQEQLEKLPLTTEQIESLLDWREPDTNPRTSGAKDEYYNSLDEPYNTSLRRLDTIEEVLLVKDWLPGTLYEPPTETTSDPLVNGATEDQPLLAELVNVDSDSPNVSSEGTQRTNINEAQAQELTQLGLTQPIAQAIVQRRNTQGTFETMRQVLEVQGVDAAAAEILLNSTSVSAETSLEGRINLNTASEAVLNSIPGMDTTATNAILNGQGSFASIGELATTSGVTLDVVRETADYFTVGSSAFLVRAMGEDGGRRVFLEAVIVLDENGATLKRLQTPPFGDMRERWGWDEEPSSENVIVETNN
jgi:general secretion pathway protein K